MVDRTRKAIVEAFNDLVAIKDFKDISIDDILKKAQISRATFYRYFKDKYDVMNYNYKVVLDRYINDKETQNFQQLYYQLFLVARTVFSRISNVLSSEGCNSFKAFVIDYSYQKLLEVIKDNRNGRGFDDKETLQIDVFLQGVGYMYEQWIKGDYNLTPEKASVALFEMMPASLKYYWWTSKKEGK